MTHCLYVYYGELCYLGDLICTHISERQRQKERMGRSSSPKLFADCIVMF